MSQKKKRQPSCKHARLTSEEHNWKSRTVLGNKQLHEVYCTNCNGYRMRIMHDKQFNVLWQKEYTNLRYK